MASKVQMLHWTKQLLMQVPWLSQFQLPRLELTVLPSIKDEPHFHDLVIRCGGGEVAVHKVIACSHSPVLKAACTGEFAVGPTLFPAMYPHPTPYLALRLTNLVSGKGLRQVRNERLLNESCPRHGGLHVRWRLPRHRYLRGCPLRF